MDNKSKQFNFLKDAPVGKESKNFFDFYHKSVAPALKSILESDTCVHTIGLFGRWGTGKSTIVKLLKDEGIEGGTIVEFDAWKYEKDSLRRQLLLQIAKDLQVNKNEIDKLEKELYFSLSETVGEKVSISWGYLKKVAILSLPFLIIIGLFTWQVFPDLATQWKLWAGTSFSLALSIALIIEKVLGEDFKKIIMVSPITSSKSQLSSPEQFEKSFVRILKLSKIKTNRVVVVIDNLDRVDSKVATEVLSTLKTFLEIKDVDAKGKNVVFLVPCDFEAIKKAAPSAELADEFLRKIFNVVVWTPEYIDTDIRTFVKEQIKQTGDIKNYLENDDVYLVIESAFSNNPREIKQFINNLISAVLVAFNTEVKDIVSNNIAYMAKVLVLMHKYPEAFQNLKKSWYAPEEILGTYRKVVVAEEPPFREEFENFMLETSRITVEDAEPFIYLKKPVISDLLTDDESIRLSLIEGNETTAKTHIEAETDKATLLEFIISILNKYKNHGIDVVTTIFKTQLTVLGELNLTSRDYINTVAGLLDGKVWPSFQKLPTDVIFDFVVADPNLDSRIRKNILDRYVLALSATEEFKNFNEIAIVKSILQNLVKQKQLLTNEHVLNIAQAIEEHYSVRDDILNLFVGIDDKSKFLTKKSIERIVETASLENFGTKKALLTDLSDMVIEKKVFPQLFKKLTEITIAHNQAVSGFTEEKEQFFKEALGLLVTFRVDLKLLLPADKVDFIKNIVQTFNAIPLWEKRKTLSLILIYLRSSLVDPQKTEAQQLFVQFLQNANAVAVREFFTFWKITYAQTLVTEFLPNIQPRVLSQPDFTKVIYDFSSDETRLQILDVLIAQDPLQAIEFIATLKPKDYARAEIVEKILNKAPTIGIAGRRKMYDFVADKINKNNDVAIKELVSKQVIELLNQDSLETSEVGHFFFEKADFLSIEKKREIVKSTLEFLRQPGKVLATVNSSALKVVTGFFSELQETLQKDYIFSLFCMIRDGHSQEVLDLAFSNLLTLKPSFSQYQKDYEDVASALDSWSNGGKKSVVDFLLQLKPDGRISATEKSYWEKVESHNVTEKNES